MKCRNTRGLCWLIIPSAALLLWCIAPMAVGGDVTITATELIERAEKARGGTGLGKKLKSTYSKHTGRVFDPNSPGSAADYVEECWYDGCRQKTSTVYRFAGQKYEVIRLCGPNGGYRYVDGVFSPLPKGDREDLERQLRIAAIESLSPLLADKEYRLGKVRRVQVNGEAALGVCVNYKDDVPVTVCFDEKTGLLAAMRYEIVADGGRAKKCEFLVERYDDVGGIKVIGKGARFLDGVKVIEFVTTQFRIECKHPESVFRRPGDGEESPELLRVTKRLQGTWYGHQGKLNGENSPPPEGGVKLVIDGSKYRLLTGQATTDEGTISIRLSKKRFEIDIFPSIGADKGKRRLGVVDVDEDRLRICMGPAEAGRPRDFSCRPGSNEFLMVFHRSSPKAAAPHSKSGPKSEKKRCTVESQGPSAVMTAPGIRPRYHLTNGLVLRVPCVCSLVNGKSPPERRLTYRIFWTPCSRSVCGGNKG